jgi:metacaspase-1
MATGLALAIGLNSVDPARYGGWSGPLTACEADAEDMQAIGRSQGFTVTTLLTKAATRDQVTAELQRAAKTLKAGDIFLLSYSGHGGQLPDRNGDEYDAQDETWCLYDGQLVDDELYALLGNFEAGVRILTLSDSCHSGSVIKLAYYGGQAKIASNPATPSRLPVYRFMPAEVSLRTYRENRELYDGILKNKELKRALQSMKASALLISGCQDNQLSADGDFNGLFTAQMLRAWNDGGFRGDYRTFHRSILRLMPPDQTPNFFRAGKVNTRFEAQRPFTI